MADPPSRPTSEIVWCGERKGRVETNACSPFSIPAMLWIFVLSIASSSDIGGMMVAIRFDNIDLPEPGGPIMSGLCHNFRHGKRSGSGGPTWQNSQFHILDVQHRNKCK